jgi:hypothetical protein
MMKMISVIAHTVMEKVIKLNIEELVQALYNRYKFIAINVVEKVKLKLQRVINVEVERLKELSMNYLFLSKKVQLMVMKRSSETLVMRA